MSKQSGFIPIPVIIGLILLILVGMAVISLGIIKFPNTQQTPENSVGLEIKSPLKDQYENPFRQDEQKSQYVNPFENLE